MLRWKEILYANVVSYTTFYLMKPKSVTARELLKEFDYTSRKYLFNIEDIEIV